MTAKILLLIFFCFVSNPVYAGTPILMQVDQAQTWLDDWKFDEAAELIRSLAKEFPDSEEVRFLNAQSEFFHGHYDKAWEILKNFTDRRQQIAEFKQHVNRTRKATNGFVSQESPHFIFRYKNGPDQILVPYAKEVMERSYEVLGKLFNYFPKEKVLVEIYPSQEPFSQISPLTLKDISTSGTVALCKYNRLMMISPGSLIRGYAWMDTLSHEYIHYLLTRSSHNTVPLWLHEGLAKYFETVWRGNPEPLHPIMETILARGLANDHLIGLQEMIPSLAKLKTAEDVHLAYAEVYTMVEYMLSLKGEGVVPVLIGNMAKGLPFAEALKNNLELDLDTFQSGWVQYAKEKNLKTIPGLKVLNYRFRSSRKPSMDDEEKDDETIESKQARDWVFLGDLLKSKNQPQAAAIEYQKAIAESKTLSPVLHNKLGVTYMLLKEFDYAEPLFQEILKYYPAFPTALANLGDLYFHTKQYDKALGYLEQAVRINPFNPFVHTRLIELYKLTGNPQKKEAQTRLFRMLE